MFTNGLNTHSKLHHYLTFTTVVGRVSYHQNQKKWRIKRIWARKTVNTTCQEMKQTPPPLSYPLVHATKWQLGSNTWKWHSWWHIVSAWIKNPPLVGDERWWKLVEDDGRWWKVVDDGGCWWNMVVEGSLCSRWQLWNNPCGRLFRHWSYLHYVSLPVIYHIKYI